MSDIPLASQYRATWTDDLGDAHDRVRPRRFTPPPGAEISEPFLDSYGLPRRVVSRDRFAVAAANVAARRQAERRAASRLRNA